MVLADPKTIPRHLACIVAKDVAQWPFSSISVMLARSYPLNLPDLARSILLLYVQCCTFNAVRSMQAGAGISIVTR
jgi:hypothetical protein